MRTVNEIEIRAPWKRVFEAAARVEHWPALLPHYRWVRVLSGKGTSRVVEMAAHRDGIPCRWTSTQVLERAKRSIHYRHIQSTWTQDMEVWWILKPRGRNETAVLLTHDLPLEPGFMGWFRQRVIGDLFVHVIAGRTLAGLKKHLER